jgi:hypothetical protein
MLCLSQQLGCLLHQFVHACARPGAAFPVNKITLAQMKAYGNRRA